MFGWIKSLKLLYATDTLGHPGIPVESLHHRIDVVDGTPTTVQYTKTIPRPVIVESSLNHVRPLMCKIITDKAHLQSRESG